MPYSWLYPFATNSALFLTMTPCSSSLFLKTQLVPITFIFFDLGTRVQTLFLANWFNSSCIAFIQLLSSSAPATVLGSTWDINAMCSKKWFNDHLVVTPFCTWPITLSKERFLGTLQSLGSSKLIIYAPASDSIDWIFGSINWFFDS